MMSGFFGNMAIAGGRQNSQRQMFNPQNLPQMQNSLLAAEMAARQSQKAVPTPEQFVAAAMNFDADQSTELDSAELTLVATAVMTELRMRQRGMPNRETSADNGLTAFSPPPPRPPNDGRTPAVPSSPAAVMQQMTAAFVNKALTFDVDGSGALNAAETQQMAIAFLRSLS